MPYLYNVLYITICTYCIRTEQTIGAPKCIYLFEFMFFDSCIAFAYYCVNRKRTDKSCGVVPKRVERQWNSRILLYAESRVLRRRTCRLRPSTSRCWYIVFSRITTHYYRNPCTPKSLWCVFTAIFGGVWEKKNVFGSSGRRRGNTGTEHSGAVILF